MDHAIGLTKDAGWQLGVRRTVAAPVDVAWQLLLETVGVTEGETAAAFTTPRGERGEIRSYRHQQKVRMSWRARDDAASSIVQLTVAPAAGGATLGVHHDHLASPEERESWLRHWTELVERLRDSLEK